VLRQLRGFEALGRLAVVDAMYLAAVVLVAWFVVGLIAGFVSLSALFGAGGVAGVAKAAGDLFNRSRNSKT
jgi:hypothetical protein